MRSPSRLLLTGATTVIGAGVLTAVIRSRARSLRVRAVATMAGTFAHLDGQPAVEIR